MQGSYFHHLFLLCIWLLVKAPQLGCDAVSISGPQDRAAANQCQQNCSLAAKAFEVSYSFHGKHIFHAFVTRSGLLFAVNILP